jgi:hypothetical protein
MQSYNGGKAGSGVYQQIINQIPPHTTYIEPFLGHGAVMIAKRPADQSYGLELDPLVASRWAGHPYPGLTVINTEALSWLRNYRYTGGEFIYCDPPYLFETRSCQQRGLYGYEFGTVAEHNALIDLLVGLPCRIALSGYLSDLYIKRLAGWRATNFQTIKRSGELATEWVWMNYPEPLELHYYRYLGDNYRERERIKRKRLRWQNRLRTMPAQERYAMFAAIEEVRAECSSTAITGDSAGTIASYGGTFEQI